MDEIFDSLRGVGAGAVLPDAAAVRARGRQRTVRARALYGVMAAAVLVAGVTAGAALAGGGTSRAVVVNSPSPTVEPTPEETPTAEPTATPTHQAVAPPPAVCAGVADCHLEATADMDGDGVVDTIAVVGHPKKDPYGGFYWNPDAHPVIRVRTATVIVSYRMRFDGPVFGHLVRGFARVDGMRGSELLIGFIDGAHGKSHSVLTLHDGLLSVLPSPQPAYPKDLREGSWSEDGSWYGGEGWACLSPGLLEHREYSTPDSPPATHFTFTRKQWRRSGSSWQLVKTVVTHGGAPDSAKLRYYSSWHGCGTFVSERAYAT